MRQIQTVSGTIALLGIALMTVMSVSAVSFAVIQEVDYLEASFDIMVGRLTGSVAGTEIQIVRVIIDRGLGTTIAAEVPVGDSMVIGDALREAATAFGLSITMPSGDAGVSVSAVGNFINGEAGKAWNLYLNGERKSSWGARDVIVFGDSVVLRYEAAVME